MKISISAIISVFLGILSIVTMPIPMGGSVLGLIAVVFGTISYLIRRNNSLIGILLPILGITLGFLGILFNLGIYYFLIRAFGPI